MLSEPSNPQYPDTRQSYPQLRIRHQAPKPAITPSTHTYRLFTLLKSVRPPGFCQTDAKRRDYTTLCSWVKDKA